MNHTQTFESVLKTIRMRLRRFGKFRKHWAVLDGLAKFVFVAPGALLAWFLMDWGLESLGLAPPALPVFVSFVAICGMSLWACARWAVKPPLRRVRPDREAVVIEGLHGRLDNSLIGSLQLGEEMLAARGTGGRLGYSPMLARTLVARTAGSMTSIRAKSLVDLSGPRQHLLIAGAVAATIAVCLTFAQGPIRQRAGRVWSGYLSMTELLFPVTMHVVPGDLAVVRGRPVDLGVTVDGARRNRVVLHITDAETNQAIEPLALTLTSQQAAHRVRAAEGSFTYRFEYSGRLSDEYRITVADLPEIKAIRYELTPPSYTGQSPRIVTGLVPRLKVLAGTSVEVSFSSTTPLSPDDCYVQWDDGTRTAIDVTGRFGTFSFTVDRSQTVSIFLVGHLGKGFENEHPLRFGLAVKPDRPPRVRVSHPRGSFEVVNPADIGSFAVAWLAWDDVAVVEVGLNMQVDTIRQLKHLNRPQRDFNRITSIQPPRPRTRGWFRKVLRDLPFRLASGDWVTLSVSTKDNNTRTGPGKASSRVIRILLSEKPLWGRFVKKNPTIGHRVRRGNYLDFEKRVRAERMKLLDKPEATNWTEAPLPVEKQPIQVRAGARTIVDDRAGLYFTAVRSRAAGRKIKP